jgi:preprotein translocase subunit SecF
LRFASNGMDIIGKKKIYFAFSLLIIIPGLIATLVFGLNLSIDFTGGSRLTIAFENEVDDARKSFVQETLESQNIRVISQEPSGNLLIVRTSSIDESQNTQFIRSLASEYESASLEDFSTIGPTIGRETAVNAIKAVTVAVLLVVIYISWVFRTVPKPASSIRFGVSTIVALVHDVLITVGVFAILGYLYKVEIDALFITALLTIIGFSVHDTIVVFDRIRENLEKESSEHFEKVVNNSILQTLGRSINTSVTVLFVLLALILFGGESIRWFVVALIVGITAGTYSSIFVASPVLVTWHNWSLKKSRNKS